MKPMLLAAGRAKQE